MNMSRFGFHTVVARELLRVQQVRFFWPVDAEIGRMYLRVVDGDLRNAPVKWAGAAAAAGGS